MGKFEDLSGPEIAHLVILAKLQHRFLMRLLDFERARIKAMQPIVDLAIQLVDSEDGYDLIPELARAVDEYQRNGHG